MSSFDFDAVHFRSVAFPPQFSTSRPPRSNTKRRVEMDDLVNQANSKWGQMESHPSFIPRSKTLSDITTKKSRLDSFPLQTHHSSLHQGGGADDIHDARERAVIFVEKLDTDSDILRTKAVSPTSLMTSLCGVPSERSL